MIESHLIAEIVHVTLEGELFEEALRQQVQFLEESEYEHTGNGMYVYFEMQAGIEDYRLTYDQRVKLFGANNPELTKFELINEPMKVHADVTVHLTDGLIDCVEIWNKLGEYPEEDLLTWQLKRKVE